MAGLSFLTDGSHEQVVYVTHRAARQARLAALPPDLSPTLAAALADQGVSALFSHQRRVWDLLAAGQQRGRLDRHRERQVARRSRCRP